MFFLDRIRVVYTTWTSAQLVNDPVHNSWVGVRAPIVVVVVA